MNAFERSVLHKVRQHHMIEPGWHVVIGLSGGADSTCLLVVLDALREELGCSLSAVHVHHGLRESADHDEAYCWALCAERGIPLTVVHADAAEYAAEHGQSVEEAGRSIRYQAFREELARQGTAGCIATAHHREDLAETVLFNLCRGSGIAGLSGIQPVMGDIVRPLLYASREEIEDDLQQRGIHWCEDETNRDTEITRNYLRREILPGLTTHVNAGTTDHLVRLAGEAAETEQYLSEQTAAAFERCRVSDHLGRRDPAKALDQEQAKIPEQAQVKAPEQTQWMNRPADAISVQHLRQEPSLLQRRILYQMIIRAAGRSKDITAAHVQAIMAICESTDGTASVNLPYGLMATRTYDTLTIGVCGSCVAAETGAGNAVAETNTGGAAGTYRMRVFCRGDVGQSIPAQQYTKWFDYDRIGAFPDLRTRREGDVITIGGGVVKSLRRFMIDDKIPRQIRDQLEIPFAGNQALWIPGHQMNAAFKVTDETDRILEITYIS